MSVWSYSSDGHADDAHNDAPATALFVWADATGKHASSHESND